MLIKPEYCSAFSGFIAPYSFKNTETIVEGMGKDMHSSILPAYQLTIHPYLFCLRYHEILFIPIYRIQSQSHLLRGAYTEYLKPILEYNPYSPTQCKFCPGQFNIIAYTPEFIVVRMKHARNFLQVECNPVWLIGIDSAFKYHRIDKELP